MTELPLRSSFRALCASTAERSGSSADQAFAEAFGGAPDMILEGRARRLLIAHDGAVHHAADPTGRISVVYHGEVFGMGSETGEAMVVGFLDQGPSFAKELNGSFAILLFDGEADRAWAITDRCNSRRLYHSRVEGHHLVSTDLSAQPRERFPLDPAGVAWVLSAGNVYGQRTLYDGIRVLRYGSAHELGDELRSESYWDYVIGERAERRSTERLEGNLYGYLVDAVRSRTLDTPEPLISLSVGFDMTAIAGIMVRELGFQGVQSFSYAHGAPAVNSDALLSTRIAGMLHLQHRVMESYEGDFVHHIKENARVGEGMANACDELDVWRTLAAELTDHPSPVIITGEQRFGGKAIDFRSAEDVRSAVGLRRLFLPGALIRSMPDGVADALRESIDADWERIRGESPRFDDLADLHDYLRWDQRLGCRIMPWRERFTGSAASVRSPFLDNDIVDFVRNLPPPLRRGKSLFRRTATSRLPDLYGFPRATNEGYAIDMGAELRTHASRLRETVMAGDSRLDELVPPEALMQAFLLAGGPPHGVRERHHSGMDSADRLTRRVRRRLGLASPSPSRRPAQLLFRRLAILREVLRDDGPDG